MSNEVIFVIESVISLAFVLLAFRLGKSWIFGYVAASAVAMNIFVMKGMYLFGWAVTGGNSLYASIFLATDVLNEYYGKVEARKAVFIGFFASIFFLVTSQFVMDYTPADYDIAQGSFETLFTLTPRIVFGSMVAYLISQNLDIWIFQKIKNATGEKYLWLRKNGSTFISQLVDSTVFTVIAFGGVYPLFELILFTYLLKIMVAALGTPLMYLTKVIKPKDIQ